ncbi:hypothetical protein T492DRAFT_846316 [Pavlovales sp. CCMP2436]|nr:hypothetical protein T492DRAFT_846316 [Pavlovales sp. CCMP2436]
MSAVLAFTDEELRALTDEELMALADSEIGRKVDLLSKWPGHISCEELVSSAAFNEGVAVFLHANLRDLSKPGGVWIRTSVPLPSSVPTGPPRRSDHSDCASHPRAFRNLTAHPPPHLRARARALAQESSVAAISSSKSTGETSPSTSATSEEDTSPSHHRDSGSDSDADEEELRRAGNLLGEHAVSGPAADADANGCRQRPRQGAQRVLDDD